MLIFGNKRGSLTIFMSLILTIVMIFTTVLIDAGKIVLSRNLIAGAGDLALAAGLSSYNTTLLDTYGLFANSKDMTELEKNLKVYLEEILTKNSLYDKELVDIATSLALTENQNPSDLFGFTVESVNVKGAEGANLSNTKALKAGILEYSKYRAPVSMGYGFMEKLDIFKSLQYQQKVIRKKKDYEEKLKDIENLAKAVYLVERSLQDYALGTGKVYIWGSENPKDILKAYESYDRAENASRGYKRLEEIKLDVVKKQDEYIDDANRHALSKAYINSVEEIPDESRWDDDIPSNSLGYDDIEQIKTDLETRSGSIGSLYAEAERITSSINSSDGNNSKIYEEIDAIASYFRDYKELVDVFRSVDKLHENKIKEIGDRIEELEEAIKNAGSHDVEHPDGTVTTEKDDTSAEESEKEELSAKKDELVKWHEKDYKNIGEFCDMETLRNLFSKKCEEIIKKDLKEAQEILKKEYDWFDTYNENAKVINGLILKIEDESKELKRRKDLWGISINELGDSGIKTDMQNDHKTKTDLVVDDYIKKNIEVVKNIEKYAETGKKDIDSIKFLGNSIHNMSTDSSGIDYYMKSYMESKPSGFEITKDAMLSDLQNNIYSKIESSSQAHGGNIYNVGEVSIPYNDNGELYVFGLQKLEEEFNVAEYSEPKVLNNIIFERQNMSGASNEKDELYKVLKSLYIKSEGVNKDEKDKKEKERDEKLRDEGKLGDIEKAGIPDVKIEAIISDISNANGEKIDTTNFGENSKKVADNVLDETEKALDGFQNLAELATSGRDALYITEYITEMFSAHTTNKKDREEMDDPEITLTRIVFSEENNLAYRAEQEYILLGNPSVKNNVDGVRNRIFAIRTLLNLIYAYTGNARLKGETFSMATTIAGWTGFGVPIVQNILMIIAAIIESVNDTVNLMDGYSVSIYKSKTTWKFYYIAPEKVAMDLGASMLYKKINTITEKNKEDLPQLIEYYVQNAIDNTKDNIIASCQQSIQEILLKAISNTDTSMASKEIIKQNFNAVLENLNNEKPKFIGDKSGEAPLVILGKIKVWEYLNKDEVIDQLEDIVNKIINVEDIEYIENASKELEENINHFFETKRQSLEDEISSIIDVEILKEDLKDRAITLVDESGKYVQKELNKLLNEFGDKLDGEKKEKKSEKGKLDSMRSALLSMSYKEYLKVFILIAVLMDEEPVIARVANVIQANATKKESDYYISEDFRMLDANTILDLEAKIGIAPTFINLDFSSYGIKNDKFIGDGKYKVEYKGVMGY